ncbi:MAG: CBS domain-containing protein, partial [Acidobacteriota bacterium]
EWEPAQLKEAGGWKPNYMRVEQFMTTDLYTVSKEDTIDLVANMMNWERIRHILVEDNQHRLVGLISYRSLLKYFGEHLALSQKDTIPVTRIMKDKPITVPPDTTTVEAMAVMKKHQIGCLPVVKDGRLVGVVTERDFMEIARDLLEQKLREEE